MDYQDREQFYRIIEEKRKEIGLLHISKKERGRLLSILDETVQRYEELKRVTEGTDTCLAKLEKAERKRTFFNIRNLMTITKLSGIFKGVKRSAYDTARMVSARDTTREENWYPPKTN
jgi:hypothetical protein